MHGTRVTTSAVRTPYDPIAAVASYINLPAKERAQEPAL